MYLQFVIVSLTFHLKITNDDDYDINKGDTAQATVLPPATGVKVRSSDQARNRGQLKNSLSLSR